MQDRFDKLDEPGFEGDIAAAIDPSGPDPMDPAVDRRTALRRMITGAAFAAPVVTSFSMDGLGVAPSQAGAGPTSPWLDYNTDWVSDGAGGGFAYLGTTPSINSYIYQRTDQSSSYLDPGAVGVRFSCTTGLNDVSATLQVQDTTTTYLSEPLTVTPPGIETDFMFAGATTEPAWVSVEFRRNSYGAPVTVDDVSVRGLYP